jgi:sulfite exporter TauE/SafE
MNIELGTAFFLGLVGSLHCAGMCGPLALALPGSAARPAAFMAGRWAYNLGRISTYSALGFAFGMAGKTLLLAGVQRWLSILTGGVLLAGLVGSKRFALSKPLLSAVSFLKTRIGNLLRRPSPASLLALGLLNGLLPCGLVYVACAGATATGGIFSGGIYMAVFGLGTVPMMLGISLSRSLVPVSWRLHFRKAVPISVFLLASLLILRGMSLGIPYLSPDLTTVGSSCCRP